MIAALLLPLLLQDHSLVVRVMHLGERPPPVRSARHVLLRSRASPEALGGGASRRTPEETLSLASDLVTRARAGGDFERIAVEHSEDPDAARGAVLGTFAPGALAPELDAFLFSCEEGAISDPILSRGSVHVLQRIDAHAAVLQILVRGTSQTARERCEAIGAEIVTGGDFAQLARERSEDPESASRGGQFAIYERGAEDTLLKAAAFRMRPGEVSRPIESPLGWHILKRVPLAEVDPLLAEPSFVRLRGILVRIREGEGARTREQAQATAMKLLERLRAGEDMRKLAREADEDPGGREREGDLGWIHRSQPGLLQPLRRACLLQVGETAELQHVPTLGFLILRREA